MSKYRHICNKIAKLSPDIQVSEERGCIVLRGVVDDWNTIVKAGQLAVDKKHYLGVINDIQLKGFELKPHLPSISDKSLDHAKPDILVIGAGITGCAIARELSKWNFSTMLVEKGPDVAVGATSANGGVVHVGINCPKNSLKLHYNGIGNRMYGDLCKQLNVPFEQKGQSVLIFKNWEKPVMLLMSIYAKWLGIPGVRYLKREKLMEHEPYLAPDVIGGLYMPIGGITSPHEMAVALAENAARNGVKVCPNTAVIGMETKDGHIQSVATNRGTIYPKLVINAAGVYADIIAEMAGDRTFTIHARRGTDIILDKKAGYMVKTSVGRSPIQIKKSTGLTGSSSHTKGVGLIHSVHGNMLVGPNAIETPEREDIATRRTEVEEIIKMQQHLAPDMKFSDVIAYFTGVRAPTYEEDFVVRKGVFTDNIFEAAGIQSPGVTAAPAIAIDMGKWAAEYLGMQMKVEKNATFDPVRHGARRLAEMSEEERGELIRQNPDYGIIVCRCEEISKGEIIDALNEPFCVPTVDGIKKRLRPGMGRCQGGFCAPLVMQIIAEHQGIPISQVKKSSEDAVITYGETKGVSV